VSKILSADTVENLQAEATEPEPREKNNLSTRLKFYTAMIC
jgi:hypothetical protein